jgi:hypothetical protein
MTGKQSTTIEHILTGHTPPIRAIAERLRSIVKLTVPEAEGRAYGGWHAIGYVHPDAGYFGAIFPRDDVVKFCFEWGAVLPDPHRVLTGAQERVRYVVIADDCDIPESALSELIQAAIAYQLTR